MQKGPRPGGDDRIFYLSQTSGHNFVGTEQLLLGLIGESKWQVDLNFDLAKALIVANLFFRHWYRSQGA